MPPDVEAAFARFAQAERTALRAIRERIFAIAAKDSRIGPLTETLKWGQPSYLTRPRIGTTLRLGTPSPGKVALFTHCQTTVVSAFRDLFPSEVEYDGNRAILLATQTAPTHPLLGEFIASALTYHLRKQG